MAELAVHNTQRVEVGRVELPDEVFAYPAKRHLMFEAVRNYLANARSGTHKTKNRVEVSGGGKKPWKQKGTGRARVGSSRSPLWRHGGIIFGPVPRDYSYDLPKKARRRALASALSEKARSGKLVIVDQFALDAPKTKVLAGLLRTGLKIDGKALLVYDGDRQDLDLASRNHPQIKALRAMQLHVFHVLNHDTIVMSRAAATLLGEVLAR